MNELAEALPNLLATSDVSGGALQQIGTTIMEAFHRQGKFNEFILRLTAFNSAVTLATRKRISSLEAIVADGRQEVLHLQSSLADQEHTVGVLNDTLVELTNSVSEHQATSARLAGEIGSQQDLISQYDRDLRRHTSDIQVLQSTHMQKDMILDLILSALLAGLVNSTLVCVPVNFVVNLLMRPPGARVFASRVIRLAMFVSALVRIRGRLQGAGLAGNPLQYVTMLRNKAERVLDLLIHEPLSLLPRLNTSG
eukprot:TRINITY_DN9947_c0_g1_i1.p1 TRINITY_DN9947_c0_g1~~TRINITY_DN9947_c0_g1_i1.p1  ORF type:complete len:253 (+),score=51.91 TRINITY_DN9947_c0_g1_i1:141-899(+)